MKTWIVQSSIIVGMNPGKPLEVQLADNPHKTNKIIGRLLDGTPVIVSIRPGRGGVPVNKLSTGKVYAIAADSFTPIFEKENNQPTKKQKAERDGTLHFSTGACYLLSTAEYKTLMLGCYYTYLPEGKDDIFILDAEAVKNRTQMTLRDAKDYTFFVKMLHQLLAPENNWMQAENAAVNRHKARKIRNAQEQADDEGYAFDGIKHNDLDVDVRDGAPAVFLDVRDAANTSRNAFEIIRCVMGVVDQSSGQITLKSMTNTERMQTFVTEPLAHRIVSALKAGKEIIVSIATGACFRQSISTKKKFVNAMYESNAGDSFYCQHAVGKWTNSMVGMMYSTHPRFPREDYTTNHYVATLRQAELMLGKDAHAWRPVDIPGYDIPSSIFNGYVIPIQYNDAQYRARA